ncbi:4-(cytidine 5'-diphospho)-2-C-methyl-D-erythritol kinase [Caldanaerobius polysaccharolyticus]|uniref:4-(cytidine 5'-diphospho)-2-C-methyl-D-erythritol kinase n=1 Tax=Caldanaerobius polysaccharolyticus TaxID=44256 RepID=UPI00047B6550|nr:4-(cytidine 5'-diphospho)-2-C-methyl-D-erythritol kinase [Caldanaerobius polysaccharolyticus]
MRIKAYAKINLSLNVLGKRSDGYHNIETVMQSIDLWDALEIKKEGTRIEVTCDGVKLPCDKRNTAYKAADIMIKKFGLEGGIKIHIHKRIPVAAGLGGGSADAAAVIKGINALYRLNLKGEDLQALGLEVGADVPFCVRGGTAFAGGVGEKLVPLKTPPFHIVLVKPDASASTEVVYQLYDQLVDPLHPDVLGQVKAIQDGDLKRICELASNGLEAVTMKICPKVKEIKEALMDTGCETALMSGSGTAVYGVYMDEKSARKAYEALSRVYTAFLAKTIDEESANG